MTQPAADAARAAPEGQLRQGGRALLLAFYTALRSLKLYPVENATVQKALDDLDVTARALLAVEADLEVRLAGDFIFVNATRLRRKLVGRFHAAIADVDAVVTVSSMEPACRIDDDGMIERTYGRQARAPFNLTGSPAIAVPTGYSSSGMPLSMQIVGKPFREAMIYRVAHAYERATEWTKRRPALAERKAA